MGKWWVERVGMDARPASGEKGRVRYLEILKVVEIC